MPHPRPNPAPEPRYPRPARKPATKPDPRPARPRPQTAGADGAADLLVAGLLDLFGHDKGGCIGLMLEGQTASDILAAWRRDQKARIDAATEAGDTDTVAKLRQQKQPTGTVAQLPWTLDEPNGMLLLGDAAQGD